MFPQYSAICGIIQQELEIDFKEPIVEFSKTLDISEEALKSLLKDNYDGYHFSEDLTDVYNPFSLISAFGNKRIFSYWFASATPTFLVNYIKEHPIDETKLDKTAEIALQQIDDKGYLISYTTEGKKLVKVGLSFSSETRTLQDWVVKES